MDPQIRFNDGAAYERMMGVWSRIAGEVFLDWVAPAKGLTWADIGCGNGAFTAAHRRALRAEARVRHRSIARPARLCADAVHLDAGRADDR